MIMLLKKKKHRGERTLIVKKLVDEDEFQPDKRKKPPLIIDLKYTSNLEVVGNTPPQSHQSQRRNPVEIVGTRPGTAGLSSNSGANGGVRNLFEMRNNGHRVAMSMGHVNHESTNDNDYNDDDEDNNNHSDDDYGENIRVDRAKLVKRKRKGMGGAGMKLGEALNNGANYNRLIDTLTDRLANTGEPARFNNAGQVRTDKIFGSPNATKWSNGVLMSGMKLQRAATFVRTPDSRRPVGFFPKRLADADSTLTGSSPSNSVVVNNKNR